VLLSYCLSSPVQSQTPEVPQKAPSLPVPPPPPRPVINFTTNLRSPHHAGCEEQTSYRARTSYRDSARHPRHLNARVSVCYCSICPVQLLPIIICQIVKVLIIILSIAICQRRNPRQACP